MNDPATAKSSIQTDDKSLHKYLIFRVGEQYYGSPLDEIIEVVEPFVITPSPNSPKDFLGMINLRGEIISVVDSRILLGQKQEKNSKMLMIIVATSFGKSAILVDELIEVHDFTPSDIDSNPNLRSSIPKDSLVAVGKFKNYVVYLVRLPILFGQKAIKEAV